MNVIANLQVPLPVPIYQEGIVHIIDLCIYYTYPNLSPKMRILNLSSPPALFATLLALAHAAWAQETQDTCNGKWNLTSKNGAEPVVAAGWKAQLVYQDIDRPRSIVMTPNGALLVLSQGVGIMSLDIKECEDGKFGWSQKRTLMEDKEVCLSA